MSNSKYTKSQLASLNIAELVQIGIDEFNLEVDETVPHDEVVEEVWQAYKAKKESQKDAAESLQATPSDEKELVEIVVAKGGENEPDYVTPAINGRVYQIKRGEKVKVPKFVARHLQSLSQTIYKAIVDKDGKIQGGRKAEEVARYNIQASI